MLRCTNAVQPLPGKPVARPASAATIVPIAIDAMTAPMPAVLDYPYQAPPAPGTTIEVAPGIHWLRMPLPFALDHINLWLLADDDGFTLVDCGYGDAATRALWEQHFGALLARRPLRRIVATHCHPDHVGNAQWLSARTGAPVAMTHAEFLTAHAIAGQHAGYGVARTIELFRRHGMSAEHLGAFGTRGNRYTRGVPELPVSFDRLLDGDTRTIAGAAWTVVEGHGHSPEHASLFSLDHGVLISGDMLLPKISTNVGVWAPEPDGDPLGRFLDSIATFETLPPDTLVLPSHGLPFRGIPVRVAQLRAHHEARLSELAAAADAAHAPVSAADVVPVLFRRPLDLQQRYFAMGEAIAHLNRLWRAGRLVRAIAADGTVRFESSHRQRPFRA
jgi:glyoxylase-like metal-dependent hydrolase (beta-lactamase superfamily II)